MKKIFLIMLAILALGYFFNERYRYPSTFVVVNKTNIIKTDVRQDFSGAILVNLDDDLDQEIFIASQGDSNLFLKKIKDELHPVQIPELSDPKGLTFSIAACDLDQDGRDELLILNRPDKINNESHSRILRYVKGKWNDLIPKDSSLAAALKYGYSAACIDRKGDGRYGLVIVSENGKLLYLESVDGKIIDVAVEVGIGLTSKGRSVLGVPGPKGHTNIFVGNEDGANFYFENNGAGFFSEKAKMLGLSDPAYNARGASLIDVNNDEIPDIVYGNDKGPTKLFEQSREGSFKEITPEIMKDAYAVNSAVVADFNLDGFDDIYLNNIRGHNKLFSRFDRNWYELDIEMLKEQEMFGISTLAADLDQDGSYEILNTHGDNTFAPITLYSIEPLPRWIKISVKYVSGSIPRGATIILRTNRREQVRVISSGSGRFANYDNEVIFGLLKEEAVLSLEVILPSGKRVEHEGVLKLLSVNEITIPSP